MPDKEFFLKLKKKKWKKGDFIVLALIGVLLLVIALPVKKEEKQAETTVTVSDSGETAATRDLEKRLGQILSKVSGAGKVEVMITYKDTGTYVVEKDQSYSKDSSTETNLQGDVTGREQSQRQTETVYDSGKDPFISRRLEPEIEGILIVAEGGEDAVVRQNLSDAVLALFDVELHRIKIVKMN